MDQFVIMLLVTAEQEKAIKELFCKSKWTFCMTGIRSPLSEELKFLHTLQEPGVLKYVEECSKTTNLPLNIRRLDHSNVLYSAQTGPTMVPKSRSVDTGESHDAKDIPNFSTFPNAHVQVTSTVHANTTADQGGEHSQQLVNYSNKRNLNTEHLFPSDTKTPDSLTFVTSDRDKVTKDIGESDGQRNRDTLVKLGQAFLFHVYQHGTYDLIDIKELHKITTEMLSESTEKSRNDSSKWGTKSASEDCGDSEDGNLVIDLDGDEDHSQKLNRNNQVFCSIRNNNNEKSSSSEATKTETGEKDLKAKVQKQNWSINRNIRMHKYHRKCESTPNDLTEDSFSPSNNGYYCGDCKFIFKGRNRLKLHKQLKKGICLPHCIYCDKDDLKDIFQCHLCPKCFATRASLDTHVARHSRKFKCIICDKVAFYTAQELKIHQNKVHKEDLKVEYLCDLCGGKFSNKKVLNEHRKFVHSDVKSEQCKLCSRRFKTKSQLQNHQLVHKTLFEVNLSCEICGHQFRRAGTLKEHVRRHNKEYSVYCSSCGKGFYKKHDLVEHMRIHSGVKPHGCKMCSYTTALKCNLNKHMRTHDKHVLKPVDS